MVKLSSNFRKNENNLPNILTKIIYQNTINLFKEITIGFINAPRTAPEFPTSFSDGLLIYIGK